MIKIVLVIGVVLACSWGMFARAQEPVTKVDRLCGYLVTEDQTGRDSVPKAKVDLYPRRPTADCCKDQVPMAEVQTKENGKFEFKRVSSGDYWLVATVKNREYRMAIDFAPRKDAQDCTWNLYTIEVDGKFILKTYVTVT